MHTTYTGESEENTMELEKYATDASAFRIVPKKVFYPKTVADIQAIVNDTRENRLAGGTASLTPRAGGTCMSGGPLTEEWVVDMTRHMHAVTIDPEACTATVEAGAYFRDIEREAKKYGLMFPAYPSSHLLCGIGGMIGNNASGEKSLRNGPTSANILSLEVVLADESMVFLEPKALSLATSQREKTLVELAHTYGKKLAHATGNVPKAASGYRLEKVVRDSIFSEIPLIVGAQGTLGIVTKAVLKLLPIPEHADLLLISAQSLKNLSDIIEIVHAHNPEVLETFDSNTYHKAEEFLSYHTSVVSPFLDTSAHLFILAQFSEDTKEATHAQRSACEQALLDKGYSVRHCEDARVVASAWEIRRNAFLLMRDHNEEGLRAVPCIEDVIVPLPSLGIFIEELSSVLTRRNIYYGFHGHIGDGSFRVIPVFDFSSPTLTDDIVGLTREVFELIKRLGGNMSADHSDGIIRTPFLKEFYGEELYRVFEDIKNLYDPENILNPGKKVGGTVAHIEKYLNR